LVGLYEVFAKNEPTLKFLAIIILERFNIERKIDKIVEIYRKLVERWV
jgi:hypothetical protein